MVGSLLRIKATKLKITKEEIIECNKKGFVEKLFFKNDEISSIKLRYFPYWIGKIIYKRKDKDTERTGLIAISDATKLPTPIVAEFKIEEIEVTDGLIIKPRLDPEEVKKMLLKGAETYALTKKKDTTIFFGRAKLELREHYLIYRPFWDVEFVKGGGRYYEADGYFTRW